MKRILLAITFALTMILPMQTEAKEVEICHAGKGECWCIEDTTIQSNQNNDATFTLVTWSGGDGEYSRIRMVNNKGTWVFKRVDIPNQSWYYVADGHWSSYARAWLAANDHLMF